MLEREADPWRYMRWWGGGFWWECPVPLLDQCGGHGKYLCAGVWTWGWGRLLVSSCLPVEVICINIKILLPLAHANTTDVSEKLGQSEAAFHGRWHLHVSWLDPGLLATCLGNSSPNLLEGHILSSECPSVCRSSDTKLPCVLLFKPVHCSGVTLAESLPAGFSDGKSSTHHNEVCDKNDGVKLCHN